MKRVRLRGCALCRVIVVAVVHAILWIIMAFVPRLGRFDGDLGRIRTLLIVRLDAIGDAILTVPLIREARRAAPDSRITLVIPAVAAELFRLCPYVDQVIPFSGRERGLGGIVRFAWGALNLARTRLWAQNFDLALLPRWDVDAFGATWLAYLSGAAFRVAFSERVIGNKASYNRGFDRLVSLAVDDRSVKHDAVRPLALLEAIGGRPASDALELWIPSEADAFAGEVLGNGGREDALWVAMAPGAGHARRMWPVERFVELAKRLVMRHGAKIVVLGGQTERALAALFERALGEKVVSVIGVASLSVSAAIIRRCTILVSNDSAPLHLASAVGTPVVELSSQSLLGSTHDSMSPVRFGPWRVRSTVLQPLRSTGPCVRSCHSTSAHCILSISVDEAEDAVCGLLEPEPLDAPGTNGGQRTLVRPTSAPAGKEGRAINPSVGIPPGFPGGSGA